MELASRDLRSHIASHKQPLNPERYREIFRDIAKAANFIHKKGVCHNDIKMENILLFNNGTAKLSDFGFASKLKDGLDVSKWMNREPSLVAPEVSSCAGISADSAMIKQVDLRKADVFAFGVTLFESLFRMLPFYSAYACETDAFYTHFAAGNQERYWKIPIIAQLFAIYKRKFPVDFRHEELQDLLEKLLAYDPQDRPTFA